MAAAVEIPVVVNIDKAFDDAAARVASAAQPLRHALDSAMSSMTFNIHALPDSAEFKSIAEILEKIHDISGDTDFGFSHLKNALDDAKKRLNDLYATAMKNGGMTRSNQILAEQYSQAIHLFEAEIDLRTKAGTLASEEARKQIEIANAIDRGNAAMMKEATTMAEVSEKISALRGKLVNLDPVKDKKAWTETAKAIKEAVEQQAKYEANLKKIMAGSSSVGKVGSIDKMKSDMKALIAQWDSMSYKMKFDENGKLKASAQKLVDKFKDLTYQTEMYGRSLQDIAKRAVPAVESTTQKLRSQSGVVRMLTSYLSIYTAIFASFRFLRNIRETTAEFEMQRVALGGIIQDTEKANSLFREIKAAAIRSPFQIKDLVKYTKQLSAYRVETDQLFHVTQKLADVSAGLGVDMNRLILAYGQVRAAAVLRGQELRQFTEAGIPMVELLAKKFQELGREGTTTADVFELISKRAVPFEMIADIFDDMTERGGVFYKMQEKQAETLKGQWTNLKDALSIMYDEMGNTSTIHNAMTSLINDSKFIFQNWRYIANAIKLAAQQFVIFKAVSLFLPNLKRELLLAKKAQDAYTRSQQLAAYAADTGSQAALRASARLKAYSALMQQAALETNFLKRAWLQLKAVMAGTSWIALVLTALSAVATVAASIWMESGRLNKELRKIGVEGQTSINRAVSNFQRLADVAVNAADGSKEQADALDELKRTYGDVIPSEQLQIENLRSLAGEYDNVTIAIRQKINEQIREQKVNAITDDYTKKVSRKQKKTKEYLAAYGLDPDQINAVMAELQDAVSDGLITIESTAYERRQVFEQIVKDLTGIVIDFGSGFRDITGRWQNVSDQGAAERVLTSLTNTYLKMDSAIKGVNNSMEMEIGTFGKFAKMSKDLEKSLSEVYIDPNVFGDPSTFASKQEKIRQSVQVYWDYIQKAFEEANKTSRTRVDITDALLGDGTINFDKINEAVKEAMAGGQNTKLNTFIQTIQEGYAKLVPSDRIVNLIREKVKELADQFNVPMDKAQMYFKDSETEIEDWVKNLQDAEKEYTSLVNQMTLNNQEIQNGTLVLKEFSKEEVTAAENAQKFLEALISFFSEFKKNNKSGGNGYQQDPFINLMNERMKFMQDFKKGYDDLNKYLSSSDAMAKVSEKMLSRGLSMGIEAADQQRAAKELSQWYEEAMNEAFEQAKKHGAKGNNYMEFLKQVINDKTNQGKAQKDFQKLIQSLFDAKTDIDISNLKKEMEDALKKLKEDIKRTETAQNFMKDIFDLTGNQQLATDLMISVYGKPDKGLEESMKELLSKSFTIDDEKAKGIQLPDIANLIDQKDVKELRKYLQYVVDDNKAAAEEILDTWEKEEADWLKNIYKSYEKARDYEERKQLVRDREQKTRDRIDADKSLSDAEKTSLKNASKKKEARDIADIEVEALKNTYEWTQAFKDLDRVSTETLEKLIDLLDTYIEKNKDVDNPEAMKTVVQAREQAQEQVVSRNAYKNLVSSITKYVAAKKKANELEKKGKKNTQEYQKAMDEARDALMDAKKSVDTIGESFNTLSSIVSSLSDVLDLDELSSGKAVFDGIAKGLSLVGAALVFINAMFVALASNPVVLAISAVIAGVASLASIMSNLNVAKANKEIKEQEILLEKLEYQYDRIGVAMEKSFGSDYIYSYNQQMDILLAKQRAYLQQARSESDKGKKADQDKIREYENSARDAADQIEDLQHQLSEFFAGTDLTSAAEDFAEAWIEAYKEFGSVTDAMSEKFNDMIQSMINKSLAAKIMQEMLQPIFDQIDELSKDGLLSTNEIAEIAALAQQRIPLINDAMTNLMSSLAAVGLDVRTSTEGFRGISKDIASASEESILGLAAGINTQNFYMSYMPVISENVSQILASMTGGVSPTAPVETTETGDVMPSVQKMVYDHLPSIDERLASLESLFKSVITGKTTSTNTNCVAVR